MTDLGSKPPRRMTREELEEEVLWLRGLCGVTAEAQAVILLRERLGLRPYEARALVALHQARGRPLRAEGLAHLAGMCAPSLTVCISRLRRRFGADLVVTHFGQGYALGVTGSALVGAAVEPQAAPLARAADGRLG